MTDDDYGVPRKDPWVEYTLEKLNELLIAQEIAQEDRNGGFTAIGVMGVIFIGSSWWHAVSQPLANQWDFLGFLAGGIALISGVALRINGQLDLRRLRRAQKTIHAGQYRL